MLSHRLGIPVLDLYGEDTPLSLGGGPLQETES